MWHGSSAKVRVHPCKGLPLRNRWNHVRKIYLSTSRIRRDRRRSPRRTPVEWNLTMRLSKCSTCLSSRMKSRTSRRRVLQPHTLIRPHSRDGPLWNNTTSHVLSMKSSGCRHLCGVLRKKASGATNNTYSNGGLWLKRRLQDPFKNAWFFEDGESRENIRCSCVVVVFAKWGNDWEDRHNLSALTVTTLFDTHLVQDYFWVWFPQFSRCFSRTPPLLLDQSSSMPCCCWRTEHTLENLRNERDQ